MKTIPFEISAPTVILMQMSCNPNKTFQHLNAFQSLFKNCHQVTFEIHLARFKFGMHKNLVRTLRMVQPIRLLAAEGGG